MHFHKKEFFQTRLEREMFYNSEIAYNCIFFFCFYRMQTLAGGFMGSSGLEKNNNNIQQEKH